MTEPTQAASIASGLRLLDLFSCAGGAAMGYRRAGFEVVGVDIAAQPRYPFEHHVGDALDFLAEHGHEFDVIHASPPCQHYTPLGALHPHKTYPDLVAATRAALIANDRPWVIENVMAALCGGMFGLRTYRHRRFEPSIPLTAPEHPKHVVRTATKQRRTRWDEGRCQRTEGGSMTPDQSGRTLSRCPLCGEQRTWDTDHSLHAWRHAHDSRWCLAVGGAEPRYPHDATNRLCRHERRCGCRPKWRGTSWLVIDALIQKGWTLTPPTQQSGSSVTTS